MFVEYRNLVLIKKTLFSEERVNLILFQNKSPLMFFLTEENVNGEMKTFVDLNPN